jgi:hypothetical protein
MMRTSLGGPLPHESEVPPRVEKSPKEITESLKGQLDKFTKNVASIISTLGKDDPRFGFFKKAIDFAVKISTEISKADLNGLQKLAFSDMLWDFIDNIMVVCVEAIQDDGISKYNIELLWKQRKLRLHQSTMDNKELSFFYTDISLVLDRVNVWKESLKVDRVFDNLVVDFRTIRMSLSKKLLEYSKTFFIAHSSKKLDDYPTLTHVFYYRFVVALENLSKDVLIMSVFDTLNKPIIHDFAYKTLTQLLGIYKGDFKGVDFAEVMNKRYESLRIAFVDISKQSPSFVNKEDLLKAAIRLERTFYDLIETLYDFLRQGFAKKSSK